jgi:Protein of unknown function (DUF3152)
VAEPTHRHRMPHHGGVRNVRVLTAAFAVAISVTLTTVGPIGPARADVPAPTLTVAGPASPAAYGAPLSFTGRLTVGDAPLAGAAVQLQAQPAGGQWQLVDAALTDADGQVAFTRAADSTADWRLLHAADAGSAEAPSATVTVAVRAALDAAWSQDAVRMKTTTTVAGVVAPGGGVVRLERQRAGQWRAVRSVPVAADGSFRTGVRPATPGFQSYRIVRDATAAYLGTSKALPRLDVYRLHTYVVRSRGHIHSSVAQFAALAAQTYADPRGWLRAHHRFRRVSSGGDFTLLLAQARYLPTYSSVCSTSYSCRVGRFVIINETRWRESSRYFTGDRATYRSMVVNHETGHWLGRPHAFCSGRGHLAPVMQQQSKGMQGCRPNAWPLPREIRAVS